MGSYTHKAAITRCKHDDSQGTVFFQLVKKHVFRRKFSGLQGFFSKRSRARGLDSLNRRKANQRSSNNWTLDPIVWKSGNLKGDPTWLEASLQRLLYINRRHFLASIRETFQSSGKESEINCGPKSIQHQSSPSICGLKKSSISRFSHETFAAMCAGTARVAAHVPRP